MRRIGALLVLVTACTWTPTEKYYSIAVKEAQEQNWDAAIENYEKVIRVSPDSEEALKAAREGSQISNIQAKDFNHLTVFLRHIILHSKQNEERVEAQKLLASTYLDSLNDYPQAIIELNKALDFFPAQKEHSNLRFELARAYFFLNQFFQARSELEAAFKENDDPDFVFRALLLKANTYFNEKKFDDSIALFNRLLKDFPEKSKKEGVAMTLAVCYEDKEEFTKAIEVLEELKKTTTSPDIIDLRIKRLKDRQAQAPGAKGLKK